MTILLTMSSEMTAICCGLGFICLQKKPGRGRGLFRDTLGFLQVTIYFLQVSRLTFRNPMRQGCGLALSNLSSLSQNSSGSTWASISSWMRVRTFISTEGGSLDDRSRRFAKKLRHFSLVLSEGFCREIITAGVYISLGGINEIYITLGLFLNTRKQK